ncbi:hypothetical protein [Rhizobium chutanense]|uniref:hypothetical protein n=1 Tax=Rhizobium chutanense TaxID=2035448 RepID=UPI001FE06193|nr:hypothetical protein [Rhizobium chutanense]
MYEDKQLKCIDQALMRCASVGFAVAAAGRRRDDHGVAGGEHGLREALLVESVKGLGLDTAAAPAVAATLRALPAITIKRQGPPPLHDGSP